MHERMIAVSLIFAALGLGGATPQPTPMPTPPMPTSTLDTRVSAQDRLALIHIGEAFVDAAGDADPGFLDVVGFTTSVDEAAESIEAVFTLREIPGDSVPR